MSDVRFQHTTKSNISLFLMYNNKKKTLVTRQTNDRIHFLMPV